jgi:hypothetical protein
MLPKRPSIWLRDSIETASGKAGAVHYRRCLVLAH